MHFPSPFPFFLASPFTIQPFPASSIPNLTWLIAGSVAVITGWLAGKDNKHSLGSFSCSFLDSSIIIPSANPGIAGSTGQKRIRTYWASLRAAPTRFPNPQIVHLDPKPHPQIPSIYSSAFASGANEEPSSHRASLAAPTLMLLQGNFRHFLKNRTKAENQPGMVCFSTSFSKVT